MNEHQTDNQEPSREEELEYRARQAVEAWERWIGAEGWDNNEYDQLADALYGLKDTLEQGSKP